MLLCHNTASCKKSVIPPSILRVIMLSKFVHSTIPCQNIQCKKGPSKSVTCSTVKSKHVNSDVNLIHKNAVNVVSNSVIARVSPCPSSSISLHSVTAIVLNILHE